MATTTTSLVISQTDPLALGGRTGKTALRLIVNRLYAYLNGSKRAQSIQVLADTTGAPVRAHGTIALATCATGMGAEVNGAPFIAITSGTPSIANGEFVISGSNAADCASLVAAINGSTNAAISGVVESVVEGSNILTPSTAIAGNSFKVVLADGTSHTFIGKAGAATALGADFSIDTSNAATATSITAQVNAYAPFTGKVAAADGTTIVTFTSQDGSAFTLTGTITTLAASDGARVIVRAIRQGQLGNAITIKTMGVVAKTTATVASAIPTDTVVINGQTLSAIQQRGICTLTAATAIAGNTFSIGGVTFTGAAGAVTLGEKTFSIDTGNTETATSIAAQINGFAGFSGIVTATSATDVVTIRAVLAGTGPNAILTTGTATTLAASVAHLTGGIAVANNEFDATSGSTDTQIATDLARCINASTTALVSTYVRATSAAAVVTIYAKNPGFAGNSIGTSSTGGTITIGAARLAGATEALANGAQANCTLTCASVLNAQTCTINGIVLTAHTDTQANNQFSIAGGDNATAAALALAINNSTTAGLAGVVATVATNVVTVKARVGGLSGNAITVAVSAATIAILDGDGGAGPRLAGGLAPITVVPSAARLVRGAGGAGTSLTITL